MKIVDRKTFLALPNQTLFSRYVPCKFGSLEIKVETTGANDFLVQSIDSSVLCNGGRDFFDVLENARETGGSFEMDFDCLGRDSLYDDEQLFAIWEPADVIALIDRLRMLVPK